MISPGLHLDMVPCTQVLAVSACVVEVVSGGADQRRRGATEAEQSQPGCSGTDKEVKEYCHGGSLFRPEGCLLFFLFLEVSRVSAGIPPCCGLLCSQPQQEYVACKERKQQKKEETTSLSPSAPVTFVHARRHSSLTSPASSPQASHPAASYKTLSVLPRSVTTTSAFFFFFSVVLSFPHLSLSTKAEGE